MGTRFGLGSTAAVMVIAVGALAACRCSGGVSGSVNDAGFSLGTPPSAAAAGASGGGSPSTTTTRLIRREHDSGRCPPPGARSLTGAKMPGVECATADECSPVCCACAGSSVSWLAAACVDGRCGDRTAACAEPLSPGFCDQPHSKSTRTGHANFRCDPKPGGKKPGEACEDGAECASTCCPCDGQRTWTASACVNGACASRSVTCAVAPMADDDYCDQGPRSSSRNVKAEQKNEACPDPPSELTGTAKTGQKCEAAADCAPSCCECGNGKSWLGAACVNKRCARSEIACLESESTGTYCGNACRGEKAPCWRDGECCSGSCASDHRCK